MLVEVPDEVNDKVCYNGYFESEGLMRYGFRQGFNFTIKSSHLCLRLVREDTIIPPIGFSNWSECLY